MAYTNRIAGPQMCELREQCGLSMRDVHRLTKQIAKTHRNKDYIVSPSRLSDLEHGRTPNLYRLHALAAAYGCKLSKILKFYRIA